MLFVNVAGCIWVVLLPQVNEFPDAFLIEGHLLLDLHIVVALKDHCDE